MNKGTVTANCGGDDGDKDITHPGKKFIEKHLFLVSESVVCNVENSSKDLEREVRYFGKK